MNATKLLLPALAVLSTPFLAPEAPRTAPAGPGGVIAAVKDFCAAVDRGDADALARSLAERGAGGPYGFDREDGRIRRLEGSPFAFFDVTAAGEPFTAGDTDEFVGRLVEDVRVSGSELETVIHSVRAECPSGDCSYAFLEFDRVIENGGERKVVPMRATALVRYSEESEPHFRLFHWHASRADADGKGVAKSGN